MTIFGEDKVRLEGLQRSNDVAMAALRLVQYRLKKKQIDEALQITRDTLMGMEEVQRLLKEG